MMQAPMPMTTMAAPMPMTTMGNGSTNDASTNAHDNYGSTNAHDNYGSTNGLWLSTACGLDFYSNANVHRCGHELWASTKYRLLGEDRVAKKAAESIHYNFAPSLIFWISEASMR